MPAPFQFAQTLKFSPESAAETLRGIPPLPGVFALFGHDANAQPYLTRAADLRRRVTRLLAPPESQSKRLNLRERVARIEYTVTGSEFESALTLYDASVSIFGVDEARRRLKLRTPYFLRFAAENAYPRLYSTNRLSKRALASYYGPFASRAAADRYCDAVLDLFKLRRCHEELAPYPEHPGCIYGEMNKCLAPCNRAHTPEGAAAYSTEAAAVHAFFETHGRSVLDRLNAEREQASAEMEFERAAEIHAQHQKMKAAADLADELVEPIPRLRALIVQKAAKPVAPRTNGDNAAESDEPAAAIFLLHAGCLTGPELLSTLGVRAVKEQTSVGSSLFAQPLMLQAVPLDAPAETPEPATAPTAGQPLNPEARAAAAIAELEARAAQPADLANLSDHLSLLRRWYYRPEKHRAGEVFFPKPDGSWPIRRILNGAARAALGDPTPIVETQRDLAQRNPADAEQKPARTKVLHAGRPDVERVVPVVEKPAFRSRRKHLGRDA